MAIVGKLVDTIPSTTLPQSDRVKSLGKELEIQARRTGSNTITANHLAAALFSQGGFGESMLKDIVPNGAVLQIA